MSKKEPLLVKVAIIEALEVMPPINTSGIFLGDPLSGFDLAPLDTFVWNERDGGFAYAAWALTEVQRILGHALTLDESRALLNGEVVETYRVFA